MKTLASIYSRVRSYVADFYEFNSPIMSIRSRKRTSFDGKITGAVW